jgi:hypothetical protein
MTYPFAGVIKMETIKDENGNDKVVWDEVKYEYGPIVGHYKINLTRDTTERMRLNGDLSQMSIGTHTDAYGERYKVVFSNNTEWARIDKDLKLVHLDMDLCAKGPANAYTALAVGIWNAALEEAAKYAAGECGGAIEDAIRELKK